MRLARRVMPLGEDILLARHGARIVEMTQDRASRLTVARLSDGTTDSASNFLVDLNAMAAVSPAERFGQMAGDYSAGVSESTRTEARLMARLSLAWVAVSAVAVGGLSWLAYAHGDLDTVAFMMGSTF